jgi:hypothetical protein
MEVNAQSVQVENIDCVLRGLAPENIA